MLRPSQVRMVIALRMSRYAPPPQATPPVSVKEHQRNSSFKEVFRKILDDFFLILSFVTYLERTSPDVNQTKCYLRRPTQTDTLC